MVWINGIDIGTLGFRAMDRIVIPTTNRAAENLYIPGRDGTLTKLKEYTDKTFSFACNVFFRQDAVSEMRQIKAFLKGAKKIAIEPQYYHVVKTVEISSVTTKNKRHAEFVVTMLCEPFEYQDFTKKTFTTYPQAVSNLGTVECLPKITVFGTGTINLSLNGAVTVLKNITSSITLDAEKMEAYTGLTTSMNQNMTGSFPKLIVGNNTLSWIGNVTRVEVEGRWRFI